MVGVGVVLLWAAVGTCWRRCGRRRSGRGALMDGWMGGWVGGWMDGWVGGCVDGCMAVGLSIWWCLNGVRGLIWRKAVAA